MTMTSASIFLKSCFVSPVKFNYWSRFHVNIITGSVVIIFFNKGLTKNPEIGNTPVWVLPIIWRLGQVRDTKFGMNVSNKMLLNAAKYQGYSFYRFWVFKGKPTGEGDKIFSQVFIVLKHCIIGIFMIHSGSVRKCWQLYLY